MLANPSVVNFCFRTLKDHILKKINCQTPYSDWTGPYAIYSQGPVHTKNEHNLNQSRLVLVR